MGVQVDMDTVLNHLRSSQIRPWISYAIRSRLGNALVIANALYLARSALLQYSFDCPHTNCTLVGDPIEFVVCYSPPIAEVLYNLAHVPSWLVISFVEWVLLPGCDQLCIFTARRLEMALFLWVSCAQWLTAGALLENKLFRFLQILARRAELSHAAEHAPREFVLDP